MTRPTGPRNGQAREAGLQPRYRRLTGLAKTATHTEMVWVFSWPTPRREHDGALAVDGGMDLKKLRPFFAFPGSVLRGGLRFNRQISPFSGLEAAASEWERVPEPLRETVKALAITAPYAVIDLARVFMHTIDREASRRELEGEGPRAEIAARLTAHVGSLPLKTFAPWLDLEIGMTGFVSAELRQHLQALP